MVVKDETNRDDRLTVECEERVAGRNQREMLNLDGVTTRKGSHWSIGFTLDPDKGIAQLEYEDWSP